MSRIEAWSWSRYETWTLCPLKAKFTYIDKLKTEASPAMARGDRIHKGVAAYLQGTVETMPEEVKLPFQRKLLSEVRAFDDKVIEQQWAFTNRWEPTGWFAKAPKAAWLRTIVDFAVCYEDMTVEVVDWKSGKAYGHNAEQVELFALSAMCHFKPAKKVVTRLVYFDGGTEQLDEFDAADKDKLIEKWSAKVAPMFADEAFIARPNARRNQCSFAKSKDGPCRFG